MSNTSGVYVLRAKDQYRVVKTSNIDRIYKNAKKTYYKPIEIVLLWGKVSYTKKYDRVMEIAEAIQKNCNTDEGIQILRFKKTWKHILADAKKDAEKWMEKCTEDWQRDRLKKVLDM